MKQGMREDAEKAVVLPGTLGVTGRLFAAGVRDDTRWIGRLFSREQKLLPLDAEKATERDMSAIALLYDLKRSAGSVSADAAWADLDMDRVYGLVDRCTSPIGEQTLYCMMRNPAQREELEERDRLATYFAEDTSVREKVRNQLLPLQSSDAYDLPNLFLAELPDRPKHHAVFPFLTMSALFFAVLLFVLPQVALAGLLLVAAVNLTVQFRYHGRISRFVRPLTLLSRLLRVAEGLSGLDAPALSEYTARMERSLEALRAIRGPVKYLAMERQTDSIIGGIYAYANALLLLDVNAFMWSLDALKRHRDGLRDLYEAIGALEAAMSIAGYRAQLEREQDGRWCRPDLEVTGRSMEMVDLVHPLLGDAVPNDLSISGRSVLITGSNMAGKTTFIRAVAINALLASTIFTCTARRYSAPLVLVRTMIGRADDLARGQSYFAAELELSLSLVDAARSGQQHLFVIDEIFRGTNTVERVAAARAVLAALTAGDHIVLAATHDLELLQLLDEAWEFHHFRESVENGELRFDYRVHAGPTSTHNAIRMMEAYGFPQDITADAHRVAAILSERNASWQHTQQQ